MVAVVREQELGRRVTLISRAFVAACLLLMAGRAMAFESELWPGEGRPRYMAKATELRLHKEPSTAAAVVTTLRVKTGTEVLYDQTRYRTTTPGRVVVESPTMIVGRSLGTITYLSAGRYYRSGDQQLEIKLEAGEAFEYLQYRAEGSCLIRRRGEVFDIEFCPWSSAASGPLRLSTPPVTELWIRATDGQRRPSGWLLITAEVVVRYSNPTK